MSVFANLTCGTELKTYGKIEAVNSARRTGDANAILDASEGKYGRMRSRRGRYTVRGGGDRPSCIMHQELQRANRAPRQMELPDSESDSEEERFDTLQAAFFWLGFLAFVPWALPWHVDGGSGFIKGALLRRRATGMDGEIKRAGFGVRV